MQISYARSSSLNNWDYCQNQYFITYVLGYKNEPNLKTMLGTIVHKVLEILAIFKKEYQKTGEKLLTIKDDTLGTYIVHWDDLMKKTNLTEEEIAAINKTRVNKQQYGPNSPDWKCQMTFPHYRLGEEVVKQITEEVFAKFKDKNPQFEWQPVNLKDVHNFVWIALDHNKGAFDPRQREIFGTEQGFDITINEPWAYYEYDNDGNPLCGYLKIKGTVDLILKVDDETLEVLDWKTGQRRNWAAGTVKELEDLQKDPQLMLYYYALKRTFPQFKNIILSIFFVRDGGPFSVCFEDSHIEVMSNFLKKKFNEIKKTQVPTLLDHTQRDFRCKYLCDYKKIMKDGKNLCKFVHDEIKRTSLDEVVKNHKQKDFDLDYYQSPGE